VGPLGFEALLQALLHPRAHGVDDERRSRVVAPRPRLGPVERLPVDDAPTHRIAFQQPVAPRLIVALGRPVAARELPGCAPGGTGEAGWVDEGVDKADPLRLVRIGVFAGEHEREGLLHPNQARKQLRAAPAGEEAKLHLG